MENYVKEKEELNSKIMEITLKIKERYPELAVYLDEMTITIPDEEHPEVTLRNLNRYYNSLNSMLNNYILQHPEKAVM
jgi:hypothetical protein